MFSMQASLGSSVMSAETIGGVQLGSVPSSVPTSKVSVFIRMKLPSSTMKSIGAAVAGLAIRPRLAITATKAAVDLNFDFLGIPGVFRELEVAGRSIKGFLRIESTFLRILGLGWILPVRWTHKQ